jgi:type IV secretory pathway TrbD component
MTELLAGRPDSAPLGATVQPDLCDSHGDQYGVFLTAALAVMYLGQLRSEQRWRPRPDALALGTPALVIGAYFSWLFHRTGSWTAWQDAEAMGWHRQNAWLWRGIALSRDSLRTAPAPDVVVSRTADLLTVLAGLVLLVVLLVLRRWPDATHLGLNVGVVAFSTLYVSAPRYAPTCFPVYLLVADLAQRPRWRWLSPVLIVACLPLEVACALAFSAYLWVA